MSTNTITLNTGQQATINTDVSKMFLWQNRYQAESYNNAGYVDVTLKQGTLMGRISATGLLIPLVSTASDGSQFPVGILVDDTTITAGTTGQIFICISGDVRSDMVILGGSDTMSTVISGRQIRDRIEGDTVGIRLLASTEMTAFDN